MYVYVYIISTYKVLPSRRLQWRARTEDFSAPGRNLPINSSIDRIVALNERILPVLLSLLWVSRFIMAGYRFSFFLPLCFGFGYICQDNIGTWNKFVLSIEN